jgi:XTP/dITP diphosphohydrolase
LHGAPGIYSARYAGEDATNQANIEKLLSALASVPANKRQAHFHCILVFMQNASDPCPLICAGKLAGTILTSPQGENGFGYDPIFYVPSLEKSLAQIDKTHKNKISHRGQACAALIKALTS